jgi:hypothetical protein
MLLPAWRHGSNRWFVLPQQRNAGAAAVGTSERSIAAQTRPRSMATLRRYVRLATAFDDNAIDPVGI